MILAIQKQKETQMFTASVVLLCVALLMLWLLPLGLGTLILSTVLFFTAFNYLEATMPSILSRIAPAGVKGTVMGIYASSQFFGAFVGGVLGGLLATTFGEQSIFFVMTIICALWVILSLGMPPLRKSKSYSFDTNITSSEQAEQVAEVLANMPGIIEATIMSDNERINKSKQVAYLKVDINLVDFEEVRAALKGN
jgi:MFS family permease